MSTKSEATFSEMHRNAKQKFVDFVQDCQRASQVKRALVELSVEGKNLMT